jgi:hypothetical protein
VAGSESSRVVWNSGAKIVKIALVSARKRPTDPCVIPAMDTPSLSLRSSRNVDGCILYCRWYFRDSGRRWLAITKSVASRTTLDTDVVDCRPTRAWKSPTEAGEKPHLHHYGRTDVNVSVNFKGKQRLRLSYSSRGASSRSALSSSLLSPGPAIDLSWWDQSILTGPLSGHANVAVRS